MRAAAPSSSPPAPLRAAEPPPSPSAPPLAPIADALQPRPPPVPSPPESSAPPSPSPAPSQPAPLRLSQRGRLRVQGRRHIGRLRARRFRVAPSPAAPSISRRRLSGCRRTGSHETGNKDTPARKCNRSAASKNGSRQPSACSGERPPPRRPADVAARGGRRPTGAPRQCPPYSPAFSVSVRCAAQLPVSRCAPRSCLLRRRGFENIAPHFRHG